MPHLFRFFSLLLFLPLFTYGQKVGVVLSGGGASGAAHIGVLKALEENNIPIDYITGTSIGALVGALYASGKTPGEIEALFTSDEFIEWSNGVPLEKYEFFYKQEDPSAQVVNVDFNLDTLFETNLPISFISSVPIDFGLMKLFAPPSAAANYNFDSLMIPFRCIAADITNGTEYPFYSGDLATAVRASMAYPFYLSPIKYRGRLLFDGGLYNNFPSDIMYHDFMPDYIIGSNVSRADAPPTEDNLVSQIKSMLSRESNYSIECAKGIIIEPEVEEITLLDFEQNYSAIQEGYKAALKSMDSIKSNIKTFRTSEDLKIKRVAFINKNESLKFRDVSISGIDEQQTNYIFNRVLKNKPYFEFDKLEQSYMRLLSDRGIKSIYPIATFDSTAGYYDLELIIKKEKSFQLEFGGIISTRPINTGYVGFRYNRLKKTNLTLSGNTYFGKLHSSAKVGGRIEFPNKLPIYTELSYTASKWDFFNSSTTLLEDINPSYLIKNEDFIDLKFGTPIRFKGKLEFGASIFELENEYYQDNSFLRTDTADINRFRGFSPYIEYLRSTLNRDQYAKSGSQLELKARWVYGDEKNIPGSTSLQSEKVISRREWFEFRFKYQNYFFSKNKFKLGSQVEFISTNQPFFNNYTATILIAPSFQPLPEMSTLFQYQYRTHSYGAFGLKTIYSFTKKLDLRVEGYIFQPYQELINNNKSADYGEIFSTRDFIGTATAVYTTRIGPIAASFNYYDKADDQYKFLIHFGYILFNKKVFE
tara:strand:- start:119 stop:2398 length:2280 start_codon:yes stop_codon:yes gene_type:complete